MKRIISLFLAMVLLFGMIAYVPESRAAAASKPGKPVVSLEALEGGNIKVVIGKTADADGFRIYMKAPGAKKFKVLKNLKKNGNAERSYTIRKLKNGTYEFKVRAYKTSGKKKVLGKDSNTVTITLGEGTAQDKSGLDAMTERALDRLPVPKDKKDKLDTAITFAEYSLVLSSIVDEYRPKLASKWKKTVSAASKSKEIMDVEDGYLMLSYLWVMCGYNHGYGRHIRWWERWADDDEEKRALQMEYVSWDYPLFPDWETVAYPDYNSNYLWGAVTVLPDEVTPYDGSNMFVYDEKNESLHLNEPLSWKTAIRAAQCMSEIIAYDTYVPADEIKCLVTDEAIEQGKKLPEAAWNKLPDWHGYNLEELSNCDNYMMMGCSAPEEYIKKLASDGFNFVRVQVRFDNMFRNGTDMSYCSLLEFEMMDELVNNCAKYGIHVCFDLNNMPGFTTNSDDSDDYLWTDAKAQKQFKNFWSLMARHFENVPTNLVSFNLLNEPHPGPDAELTDEAYTRVMMFAIDAIREITPDRLIFTDFLGMIGGHPVEGLADARVAQAAHPYFLNKRTLSWPVYAINGFVNKKNGDLTLRGSFKKNTEITIEMLYLDTPAKLSIFADEKELSVIRYGNEGLGENGCIEINDEGTKLEWRRYSGRTAGTVLPEDCDEIRLVLTGDSYWYYLQSITVGDIYIIGNDYYISDTENCPILTISADGSVSAEVPSTMKHLDVQTLKEQFASYKAFTDRTGEEIMIQEFGFYSCIPSKTGLMATKDMLDVMKEYSIPWCVWCNNVGPVMDSKWAEAVGRMWTSSNGLYGEENVYRPDSTYEPYVDRYVVDTELMELYKKYMK